MRIRLFYKVPTLAFRVYLIYYYSFLFRLILVIHVHMTEDIEEMVVFHLYYVHVSERFPSNFPAVSPHEVLVLREIVRVAKASD